MRNRLMIGRLMIGRLMIGAAVLLLASATFAGAQDNSQQDTAPSNGSIEVAGRFTSTTGDEARYERYRDLRDGANVIFRFSKETSDWTLDVKADNIGYRDQRYTLDFNSRRVKVSLLFDQTPLNYAYYSRTPFNCTAGECTLDPGLRAQVEAGNAVGVPANAGELVGGSIYNSIARTFDLQSRRDTFSGEARISATDNLDFIIDFNTYKRSGTQPYGAAFAFRNAIELPMVIDNRETEVSVGVEWASHQGMFGASFEHAKFNQNIPLSLRFDNPYRLTDFCEEGFGPPGTCYDERGYSTGNGPAFGTLAVPPSNTLNTFSTRGMVKLPGRTTANASFSMGASRQDEPLIAWTTNPVIANATVYEYFPGLASLPRDTADLRVNFTTATANVRSRPHNDLTLTARYRFNSRSDFRRAFEAEEYVRFDAVPEEGGGETHPLNINRNTFDVNAAYTAIPFSTIRVGYGFDRWEHAVRAALGWEDNTFRVGFDTVGNQYVTLRALYEHTQRDSISFDVEFNRHSGHQDALRFYDEASRTRNRGTLIAELSPVPTVGINVSVATGKDDYAGADPSQEFGLLNNKNTAYNVGIYVAPNDRVDFGANYGRETYDSLQESRNASPPPSPQFTDPERNWNLTIDEKVNNFSLYLNLVKALAKTDIRFGYDYSDSDQGFVHGGPRIPNLTFVALPNVTNKWQYATFDLQYSLSEKVGLGLTYWYEKFDVEDYSTINSAGPATLPLPELGAQTSDPRFDWLGGLMTGYGNRPYKGQTVFARVVYMF